MTDLSTLLTPKHGYLLRAFHDWLEDNDLTPYLMIDANCPDLVAPTQYAQDGRLVLCISYDATKDLRIANDGLSFSARFGGVSQNVWVPMNAVLALYAKELPEQIIMLSPDEYNLLAKNQPNSQQTDSTTHNNAQNTQSTKTKKANHLKIIK